jgi:hypothetical protein
MTTPSPKIQLIELPGKVLVFMVFASLSGKFYHKVTNLAHLSGPRHLDNFFVTKKPVHLLGLCPPSLKLRSSKQKTDANPDTHRCRSGQAPGNSLDRGAVSVHIS